MQSTLWLDRKSLTIRNSLREMSHRRHLVVLGTAGEIAIWCVSKGQKSEK